MSHAVINLYIHHQLLRHLCLKELLTMDFSTSRSPIWDGPRKWNMSMLLRVGWALHKRLHPNKREKEQSALSLVLGPVACPHRQHEGLTSASHLHFRYTTRDTCERNTDTGRNSIGVSMLICIFLLSTLSLCFPWAPLGPAWPFRNIQLKWLAHS